LQSTCICLRLQTFAFLEFQNCLLAELKENLIINLLVLLSTVSSSRCEWKISHKNFPIPLILFHPHKVLTTCLSLRRDERRFFFRFSEKLSVSSWCLHFEAWWPRWLWKVVYNFEVILFAEAIKLFLFILFTWVFKRMLYLTLASQIIVSKPSSAGLCLALIA